MTLSPNKIKYTNSNPGDSIKVKNFALGLSLTPQIPYGPTSSTGFWNGITPPIGGYTIYINKAVQGPSIYVPINDAELDFYGRMLGATGNTLSWFAGQSDMICVNIDYPDIVTNGLITLHDVGYVPSFPRNGNIFYDLSFSNRNSIINGGIEYGSVHGGIFTFDSGLSPYITLGGLYENLTRGFTICAYINFGNGTETNERIVELYDNTSGDNIIFSRDGNTNDLYFEVFNQRTSLGSVVFSNAIIDNTLAFYAVTVNSSTTTLHVNNSSQSTNINLIPRNTRRDSCFFGKSSSGSDSYFGGELMVIMIYDIPLTESQVRKNYAAYVSR